jgi:hypothetical protein
MITWLEEAYRIDESYEAICQILAADGDGCTCTPNLYEKLHSLADVAKGGCGWAGVPKGCPRTAPDNNTVASSHSM